MPSNFGDKEQREEDPSAHEQRFDQETNVKRNPHPDFKKVEAARPDWAEKPEWHFYKTKQPRWKLGQGANDGGESLHKKHVEIDPYEEGRPSVFNYKLLISGIVPRPIGFISTQSEDGQPSLEQIPPFIKLTLPHPAQAPPPILPPSPTPTSSTTTPLSSPSASQAASPTPKIRCATSRPPRNAP